MYFGTKQPMPRPINASSARFENRQTSCRVHGRPDCAHILWVMRTTPRFLAYPTAIKVHLTACSRKQLDFAKRPLANVDEVFVRRRGGKLSIEDPARVAVTHRLGDHMKFDIK